MVDFFFKKWNGNEIFANVAFKRSDWEVARLASPCCFDKQEPFRSFAVCFLRWFWWGVIFCFSLTFCLCFSLLFYTFLSTNRALVFVSFFLVWVFAVFVCRFCALFTLPHNIILRAPFSPLTTLFCVSRSHPPHYFFRAPSHTCNI